MFYKMPKKERLELIIKLKYSNVDAFEGHKLRNERGEYSSNFEELCEKFNVK